MNHKYRKKPVFVEAFQFTEEAMKLHSDWPEWLHSYFVRDDSFDRYAVLWVDTGGFESGTWLCKTAEGIHEIIFNDWIIREASGPLHLCDPGIFANLYELDGKN